LHPVSNVPKLGLVRVTAGDVPPGDDPVTVTTHGAGGPMTRKGGHCTLVVVVVEAYTRETGMTMKRNRTTSSGTTYLSPNNVTFWSNLAYNRFEKKYFERKCLEKISLRNPNLLGGRPSRTNAPGDQAQSISRSVGTRVDLAWIATSRSLEGAC